MVCFGRDLKAHLVPTPCCGQGHFSLDQVSQSPIKPGLKNFQGWCIGSFSGKLSPVHDKSLLNNFYLTSNLNIPSLSLMPLSFVLSLHPLTETLHSFSVDPFRYCQAAVSSPWSLLFSRLKFNLWLWSVKLFDYGQRSQSDDWVSSPSLFYILMKGWGSIELHVFPIHL